MAVADEYDPQQIRRQVSGQTQTTRVLANDYSACRLAQMVSLTVPQPVIIEVDEETIRQQQITFLLAGCTVAPKRGLQFGTRQVGDEQAVYAEVLPDRSPPRSKSCSARASVWP